VTAEITQSLTRSYGCLTHHMNSQYRIFKMKKNDNSRRVLIPTLLAHDASKSVGVCDRNPMSNDYIIELLGFAQSATAIACGDLIRYACFPERRVGVRGRPSP
jgi:hypothetical protein